MISVVPADALKGCHQGLNFFLAVMEKCSVRDAALKLQNWFKVQASNERPADYVASRDRKKQPSELVARKANGKAAASPSVQESMGNPPLAFELKSIDHTHTYLKHRGVKPDTAEFFGVGHFFGKGSMSGRLVILTWSA